MWVTEQHGVAYSTHFVATINGEQNLPWKINIIIILYTHAYVCVCSKNIKCNSYVTRLT